tara:strand:- start:3861 stop:4520 length:660 start_codon:yes stop_codon:yes gene_type:complete
MAALDQNATTDYTSDQESIADCVSIVQASQTNVVKCVLVLNGKGNKVYFISGPHGGGKTTLIKQLSNLIVVKIVYEGYEEIRYIVLTVEGNKEREVKINEHLMSRNLEAEEDIVLVDRAPNVDTLAYYMAYEVMDKYNGRILPSNLDDFFNELLTKEEKESLREHLRSSNTIFLIPYDHCYDVIRKRVLDRKRDWDAPCDDKTYKALCMSYDYIISLNE